MDKNVEEILENTRVQMRKGILEFCILGIISKGEVYASDILEQLKSSKLLVVEGTVYPLLTRLKNAALLSYVWRESTSGPPRKYFTITPQGEEVLNELIQTWHELDHAVEKNTKHLQQ
jgi:PadR family transcriptional regulator, regulatory protein PadR